MVAAIIGGLFGFSTFNTAEAGGLIRPATTAVKFSLTPSSATVEVGKTVNVAVEINTFGQKVAGIQTFVKFDPTAVEVVDKNRNEPGSQPKLGNCVPQSEFTNIVAPGDRIGYVAVNIPEREFFCYAVIVTFKGKKTGTTSLNFDTTNTEVVDERGNKLTSQLVNGTVTVNSTMPKIAISKIGVWKTGQVGQMLVQVTTDKPTQWWFMSSCGMIIFTSGGTATADKPYDQTTHVWIPAGAGNNCTIYVNGDYDGRPITTRLFNFYLNK